MGSVPIRAVARYNSEYGRTRDTAPLFPADVPQRSYRIPGDDFGHKGGRVGEGTKEVGMTTKKFALNLRQGSCSITECQHGQTGRAPWREGWNKGRVSTLQIFPGNEHAFQRGMGKAKQLCFRAILLSNVDLPGHGDLNREDLHGHCNGITRLDRDGSVERKEDVASIDTLFAQRRIRHCDRWRQLSHEPTPQTMQRSGSGNRQRASKMKRLGARGARVHGEWFRRRAQ